MSQEKPPQILNYCVVFLSEAETGPFWLVWQDCITASKVPSLLYTPIQHIHTLFFFFFSCLLLLPYRDDFLYLFNPP